MSFSQLNNTTAAKSTDSIMTNRSLCFLIENFKLVLIKLVILVGKLGERNLCRVDVIGLKTDFNGHSLFLSRLANLIEINCQFCSIKIYEIQDLDMKKILSSNV